MEKKEYTKQEMLHFAETCMYDLVSEKVPGDSGNAGKSGIIESRWAKKIDEIIKENEPLISPRPITLLDIMEKLKDIYEKIEEL